MAEIAVVVSVSIASDCSCSGLRRKESRSNIPHTKKKAVRDGFFLFKRVMGILRVFRPILGRM